jgi:hypothetical protein
MTLFIDSGRTAPRSFASPGSFPTSRTAPAATAPRSTLGPAPRVSVPIRSVAAPGSFPTGRSFAMPTFDPSLAIPAVDPATIGSDGGSGDGGGGWGDGGGWSFDTDPGYQMALAQEQAGLSSVDANEKAARERAIIGFGDPALADLAGFGLDPQAADFARQNYLSGNATLSRLDKEKDDKRRAIINALAGHGILESGDLGYQEGQASLTYGQNVYDARNKVLDYLRQVDQDAQDRKNALRQSVVAALQNAFASGSGGRGGGGGGGGVGGLQFQPDNGLSQRNLAAAGYTPEQVSQAVHDQMAQHGWGNYVVNGAVNAPMVHDNGQVKTDPNGHKYIDVKVGYPGGAPSTEKIYLP